MNLPRNTANVEALLYTFGAASAFNQQLHWNTSSVATLLSTFNSTAVWTVAPMIIHVKRVTMHSYPG